MAIISDYDYYKPMQINKALSLLDKFKKRARILAGGTDLIVKMKDNLEQPQHIIDIKGIDVLNKIEQKNNSIFIGASVCFNKLIDSSLIKKRLPLLWESVRTVGSVGVRNRATLAGNICSAVPSLDSGPALLVYEAKVEVKSIKAKRSIPISKWFLGPKRTVLKNNEIVLGITIPVPKIKYGSCYMKLGRYKGEDLAQAGVGVLILKNNTYRISFCALGPVPVRAYKLESMLKGKLLSDELIINAQDIVPQIISPITDIRATKEYRMHMAQEMLKRGLQTASTRLKGKGPDLGESLLGG